MAQYEFPVIDPATDGGAALAGYLNSWRDAVLSGHSGGTRPGYAIVGMVWNTGGATPVFSYFDGSNDQQLFTRLGTGGLSIPNEVQVPGVLIAKDGTFTYKGNDVVHKGDMGSGSGLDADTVDGVHLSGLAQLGGTNTFTGVVKIASPGVNTQLVLGHGVTGISPTIALYVDGSLGSSIQGRSDGLRLNYFGGSRIDIKSGGEVLVDSDRVYHEGYTDGLVTELDYEKITDGTVTAAASTDIALPTGYRAFDLLISGMTCTVDSYQPLARLVQDNDTLLDGPTDYNYSNVFVTAGAGGNAAGAGHDSKIELNPGTAALGNAAGELFHGKLTIQNPRSATEFTSIFGQAHVGLTTGAYLGGTIQGQRRAATAEKAIRLYADTGNLTFTYALYGIK